MSHSIYTDWRKPDIDPMGVVYLVSFLLHIALVKGVAMLDGHRPEPPPQIVSIALPAIPEAPQPELPEPEPEPAPEPEAPAPTPPPVAPPPTPRPAPRAEPSAAAPEAAPEAAPAPGVLASNLVLGGTVQVAAGDGSSGVSTGAEPRTRTASSRRLEAPTPEPTAARRGGCAEEPSRPRPLTLPRPSFTDAARAAGIEGRVRLRVHVAADGSIANVEVLEGLGHGLDEAAERAVREARFEPGLACERAVETSVVLSIRFTASA